MFFISWNSNSPLKYKCVFIIVKRKPGSVRAKGLEENTY